MSNTFFIFFKYLGAWWLGWIILGVITLLVATLIGLFPRYLPKKKEKENIVEKSADQNDQRAEIVDIIEDKDVTLKSEFNEIVVQKQ